ncbi:MAG: AraC family transcriptional regulator [Rikenella sp.]|nr:AraC family transcriptional regulator [Rikenella sp.]
MSELPKTIENTAPSASGQKAALWQYETAVNHGAEWVELADNLIGIIESGTKTIQYPHGRYTVRTGEVFFLAPGKHYIENIPDTTAEQPYRELCLAFDNRMIADAFSTLVSLYGMDIRQPPGGRPDPTLAHVNVRVWQEMQLFFDSLNPYRGTDYLAKHPQLMRLKLAEFAYMVIAHKEYGLQHKLLQCIDRLSDPFESIIRSSIFENLTIEELALRTNKSLTSFKNDFQRVFGETPHRWIIRQRLLHARLLVVSTNKAISQIGYECRFDNISHFIKLFKREFGLTPLSMRQEQRQ